MREAAGTDPAFTIASDLFEYAKEKRIKLASFEVQERKNSKGSYDFLTASFIVPRRDKDREKKEKAVETTGKSLLEKSIKELESELAIE